MIKLHNKLFYLLLFSLILFIGKVEARNLQQEFKGKIVIKTEEKINEIMPNAMANLFKIVKQERVECFSQNSDNGEFIFDDISEGQYLLEVTWIGQIYKKGMTSVEAMIKVDPNQISKVKIAFPNYLLTYEKMLIQQETSNLIININGLDSIYIKKPNLSTDFVITKKCLQEVISKIDVQKNLAIIICFQADPLLVSFTDFLLQQLGFKKVIIYEDSCLGRSIVRE